MPLNLDINIWARADDLRSIPPEVSSAISPPPLVDKTLSPGRKSLGLLGFKEKPFFRLDEFPESTIKALFDTVVVKVSGVPILGIQPTMIGEEVVIQIRTLSKTLGVT
jgi:hypothetical protein